MKISVVEMGRVGSVAAFALVARAIPHELVLIGRTREKTLGDAHDLQHAAALVRPIRVVAGDVADSAGSDIVVLAASAGGEAGGDRLAFAAANARLLREVVPPLAAASPGAVFVVLTNPVDIGTYVTLRATGLPPGRVLGTGTQLDTARFRAFLSRETGINTHDIRAYILGEHGESQFPVLSLASAGGVRLDPGDATVRGLAEEARQAGGLVLKHKGYTNHAVALTVATICEAIADDTRSVLPVSTLVDGFLGIRDVCLSLPCVVGRGGVVRVLAVDLDGGEADLLRRSAGILRAVLDQLR